MDTKRWTAVAVALGLAVGLTACSPSGSDDDDSDESTVSGTWSGNWQESSIGPLFAHGQSGTIALTLDEEAGSVTGTIAVNPDPCSLPQVSSEGAITGTLSGVTLELTYDTEVTSTEQSDNTKTAVTFSGEVVESTQQIRGTYNANACTTAVTTWTGQFVLDAQ